MPMYTFKCNTCDEIFDVLCNIASKDTQICPKCGSTNYQHHHTVPLAMGDPVRLGVRRVDDGFREVLSKIGNANGLRANLTDKLSRR